MRYELSEVKTVLMLKLGELYLSTVSASVLVKQQGP